MLCAHINSTILPMNYRILASLILTFFICGSMGAARNAGPSPALLTLRASGAVGDGRNDDRAAIEKALNLAQGAPVDGEGLIYAVRGNIEVTTSVDFRNATLVQTMGSPDTRRFLQQRGSLSVSPAEALRDTVKGLPVLRPDGIATYSGAVAPTVEELPALIAGITLRTLSIRGAEGKPVKVNLERIKVDRGQHPQSGGRTEGAGIQLQHASPVHVKDVVITGDGKGTGLTVSRCVQVRVERLHVHDMNWAPYEGDDILDRLSADEVRDDFGWNNFPIYEYRSALKGFVRVRIQEQLVGVFVSQSEDVEIRDSRIERLQTKIGDRLYPLQSDAITIGQTKKIVVRNCEMVKAWEGIDFTGRSGQDFVFENCLVVDTIGWAFKLAHPKQNGKIIDCIAVRGGIAGFLVGAGSENVELIRCRAVETAGNGYWNKADGTRLMTMSGFRIQGSAGQSSPRGVRIEDCSAINQIHPGAIDYGILCDAPVEGRDIKLAGFLTTGAKIKDHSGIQNRER